jgi:hypothetical protein
MRTAPQSVRSGEFFQTNSGGTPEAVPLPPYCTGEAGGGTFCNTHPGSIPHIICIRFPLCWGRARRARDLCRESLGALALRTLQSP